MNGDCGESIGLVKGKGKGKGKGKSNTIINKTSSEEEGNVEVAEFQRRPKRICTPKNAAEMYRNILNNDNENEDDELLDEDDSDEDAVYGQDDSESDDDEEVVFIYVLERHV